MKVIRHPRPGLRHTVGSDGFAILLLRRWLPYDLFEHLIEWMFTAWKPRRGSQGIPRPNQLGLHRIFFHQPTRDWLLRAAALALGAAFSVGAACGLIIRNHRRTRFQ
jgi:hypothetical protein